MSVGVCHPPEVIYLSMEYLAAHWESWIYSALVVIASVFLARAAHYFFFRIAKRLAADTKSDLDNILVQHSEKPAKLIFPLGLLLAVLPATALPPRFIEPMEQFLIVGLIAGIAWWIIGLTAVVEEMVAEKYRVNVADNLAARQVQTQVHVLRKIAVAIISIFALAVMLMTFPRIRQLGTSIFASAGLAGLIVGLAARSTLSNLIAGLQVALTQPIRIDDVVIVDGEWGWVEEINTTYVVVRIWDLRRLVVPLSYFIEKPFQNWTRVTADLLGTVFVYVDYTVPVDEVRKQLHVILESTPLWDGKVWNLQVTNASERTIEMRALMSASNSEKAWDLRCFVREQLLRFLQEEYPESLPRVRAEIHDGLVPPSPLPREAHQDLSRELNSSRREGLGRPLPPTIPMIKKS